MVYACNCSIDGDRLSIGLLALSEDWQPGTCDLVAANGDRYTVSILEGAPNAIAYNVELQIKTL